jgi:amino acid adenylation domain-containing protein
VSSRSETTDIDREQQREYLQNRKVIATQLSYWKKQLDQAPPLVDLPTDRSRPAIHTYQGGCKEFELNSELSQQLVVLSQTSGTTLFMTLLAAVATLLSRYSGQDDIVIGAPIASRHRQNNILVLRTQLSGNPSFSELLDRVRSMTLAASEHQDLPFEHLVAALQPEPDRSYAPMFQVKLLVKNDPLAELELSESTLTPLKPASISTNEDLFLLIELTESGLVGKLAYNQYLFDRVTIDRLVGNFQTLLTSIVSNPAQSIASLELLTPDERQQLLTTAINPNSDYPLDQCFPQLFEQQVARTPDAIAAVFAEGQLTYHQLNTQANRWANYLVDRGVGAETLVALLGDRSLDFLTAILAIFKAGGAYLPLNPDDPIDRLAQICEQSQVPFMIATNQLAPLISQAIGNLDRSPTQILSWEELAQSQQSPDNLPIRCHPGNLAYVIYTSGSTGKPKGAMLEQRGMLNHLYAKVTDLQLTATDVVAQTAPQSFDISVWQFLIPLLIGGRVEIIPHETTISPAWLLKVIETRDISILEIVPSLLRMILQQIELAGEERPKLAALRWMILTGETLPPQLCRQWLAAYPDIPMMNAYGPTECSDDVTHYPIYRPPAPEVWNLPIGRPIANTQLYILDPQLQPVPFGVAGELYVGGVGVGRGYLNNSAQTLAAFIDNPFGLGRLYKTGDKARYLADGNLEFLGRLDYQVKIHGVRIELGEIEQAIDRHPQVRETVVTCQSDLHDRKYLVAYIVCEPGQTVSPSELRHFLKQILPTYAIPAAAICLAALPLTPNGKVDRLALPKPTIEQIGRAASTPLVAPRDRLELQLTKIWSAVLGIHIVGVDDNFFELGGTSLLAMHLVVKIKTDLHSDLSVATIFQAPTISELVKVLRAETTLAPWYSLVPIQPQGSRPILFGIHLFIFGDLSRHLGIDQPIYGLRYGISEPIDRQISLPPLTELVAHYIAEMRSLQPTGPYLLMGLSRGGIIAYEMAQQLIAQGEKVELLVLFDTTIPEKNSSKKLYPLPQLLANLWNLGLAELGLRAGSTVKSRLQNWLRRWNLAPLPDQRYYPYRDTNESMHLLLQDYYPQPYADRVLFFKALNLTKVSATTYSDPPDLRLKKMVTGELKVVEVPSSHTDMLIEPHARLLAEKLRQALDRVQELD